MLNRKLILPLVWILILTSCKTEEKPSRLEDEAIIPLPTETTSTGGYFTLNSSTTISDTEDPSIQRIAGGLTKNIEEATGIALQSSATDGTIRMRLTENPSLGVEGYLLEVTEDFISIEANAHAGLFYATQTLWQLIPPSSPAGQPIQLATGTIRDLPVYEYRGAMLDVSRHFFPVEDVMRFIDFLAMYKMNVLHLHLSDDQGWRIEIKSWPLLATKGGSTEVGGGIGGYFTQDDYKAIVNYASDRFITIVPEIDMPGHTNAALVAYPELNCDGRSPELYTGTDVGFSTLCTDREATYQFVEDVVTELAAMTPGPYIHIGGDESHVTEKDDYIRFVSRVQQIVDNSGKRMIGWDETVQADLSPNALIQHWASADFARQAVKKGNKLIMSPASRTYLDMKYDSTTTLGLNWAGYIEVDHGYDWDPTTLVEGVNKENILGIEAPLWSETVTNMDEIEYLTFPRLPGYAEIGWSGNRTVWDEYKQRLARHGLRMEAMDIGYYPSPVVPWP